MSCPIDTILDPETQKTIDTGMKYITDKIQAVRKTFDTAAKDKKTDPFKNCASSKLNKGVLWTNIALQIVVLVFLAYIAATKGEKDWSIDALIWISWATLALVFIQYKDVLLASVKLFLYGVGRKTQIVTILSLIIVLLTKLLYAKEGFVVSIIALAVFLLIAVRVGFQIQSTLDTTSVVPIFLDFINRVVTSNRINMVKNAFA